MDIKVTCENGHTSTIEVGPDKDVFRFHGKEAWQIVAKEDQYAYTHGGCCYQAACDAIWGDK